jgi:hypothetical protein
MDIRTAFKKKSKKSRALIEITTPTEERVIDIPPNIHIVYQSDYDIHSIDTIIRAKLALNDGQVKVLMDCTTKIQHDINNAESVQQLRSLQIELMKKNEMINYLSNQCTLKRYIGESNHLLQEYDDLPREVKVIDVMYMDYNKLSQEEILRERMVEKYFDIARKYMTITVEKEKSLVAPPDICIYCGLSLRMAVANRSGHRICPNPNCGSDNKITRLVAAAPKEYDVLANFLKTFRRHMGIQTIKFSIDVLKRDLDIHFASINKHVGKYYRSLPLDANGRKKGTSHKTLTDALDTLGYKDFYKDYMFICHKYYGWELPKIGHLLETVKLNFTRTQNEWKKLTPAEKEGSSSLPTQYRLCMELRRVGYMAPLSDYRLPTVKETLRRYDRVYQRMSERAGFTFISILKDDTSESNSHETNDSHSKSEEISIEESQPTNSSSKSNDD